MSAGTTILSIVFIMAAVIVSGCLQPELSPNLSGHVSERVSAVPKVTVPFTPVPVPSASGINLAYELALEPPEGEIPVVEKVDVLDAADGRTLYTLDGELLEALYHPAAVPPPSPEELRSGTVKLAMPRISIWFVVSPDAIPDRLSHRITLDRTTEGLAPLVMNGPDILVLKDAAPVVVSAPVDGAGWLAMETTSPVTHHFRAQVTMDGVTRVPQRYAQDWVYLDPVTGQAAGGNASIARNYFGFGKEIRAVAAGTVAEAGDGLPDIETIYSAPAGSIGTLAGNYVIVDIGNKKYACYAHLENGSVRVKKGDVVQEGQVLGLVGNSGNSDIPHLHFQVVTGSPSFLGAEGYPHVYRSFAILGGVNETRAMERQSEPGYTMERLWSEIGMFTEFFREPVPQENRLMENNAIIRFP